ncbi:MAG: hypothetical protein NC086_02520 [Alistipes sp.]|nr:hypothetical protein [Alistipes sp.]
MVLLSEFIGELVADISDARKIADANSIMLSQTYHADPFLKGMPVPHYTVEEAEVSFPLTVLGINTGGDSEQVLTDMVLNSIKIKLPQLLLDGFKNYYLENTRERKRQEEEDRQAAAVLRPVAGDTEEGLNEDTISITKALMRQYAQAAAKIPTGMQESMKKFLEKSNFDMIKLLDIRDEFMRQLKPAIRTEVSLLPAKNQPVTTDEELDSLVEDIGQTMFFEFKQYEEERGILVDPGTGKMNEYGKGSNLMNIKIKVKEQDLDIVVSEGAKETQRFLSLN